MKTAADLKYGEKVKISLPDTSNQSHQRILEIGFIPDQEIEIMSKFVINDPTTFSVRCTLKAMRKKS